MGRSFRLLLAWLLLAVLPLQGVAAAAMSGCPGHHADSHAVMAADGHDAMADGAAHCDEGQPKHACESCGGCCLAGALALPAAAFQLPHAAASAAIGFDPPFATPVLDHRLERPPR